VLKSPFFRIFMRFLHILEEFWTNFAISTTLCLGANIGGLGIHSADAEQRYLEKCAIFRAKWPKIPFSFSPVFHRPN
jgi:hypothetical protein